jgi:hypothetical protein
MEELWKAWMKDNDFGQQNLSCMGLRNFRLGRDCRREDPTL